METIWLIWWWRWWRYRRRRISASGDHSLFLKTQTKRIFLIKSRCCMGFEVCVEESRRGYCFEDLQASVRIKRKIELECYQSIGSRSLEQSLLKLDSCKNFRFRTIESKHCFVTGSELAEYGFVLKCYPQASRWCYDHDVNVALNTHTGMSTNQSNSVEQLWQMACWLVT